MADQTPAPGGVRSFRAGEGVSSLVSGIMTTERGVAVWVLAALAGMIIVRRGFRGALGD